LLHLNPFAGIRGRRGGGWVRGRIRIFFVRTHPLAHPYRMHDDRLGATVFQLDNEKW